MDKALPTPVPSNSEGDDEKGTIVAPNAPDQPQDSSNESMISAEPAELGSSASEGLAEQEGSTS